MWLSTKESESEIYLFDFFDIYMGSLKAGGPIRGVSAAYVLGESV